MSGRAVSAPPELQGFRFVEPLGKGGFAEVFKYEQLALGRQVAVKVLHQGLGATALEHFRSEANLMAKLSNHPSIVSIYQAGVADDGRPYLVMEFCPPPHLGVRIRRRPLSIGKALEVAVQLAGAVETAHRLGILHRDIKPANILFTEFGRPALTDFGISSSTATTTTAAAFSPAWAPPEQIASQPMSPAGDVYSLGATLWAMLRGHSPFEVLGGENDNMSMAGRVRSMPAPPTRRDDVPESLERLLRMAMAKDPARRHGSAIEFARALQGVQAELHQSVTPLVIREDSVEDDYTLTRDEGTRVTGFVAVDPERPSGTVDVSHEINGDDIGTHPTGWRTGGSLEGFTGAPGGPRILWHGRGSRPAEVPREFTGPAIPELSPSPASQLAASDAAGAPAAEAHTAAGSAAAPSPERSRVSRRGSFAVGAATVLVVALGGWWALNNSDATTPDDGATAAVVGPRDPVGQLVPSPTNAKAVRDGDAVVVSWDNLQPEEGDYFRYRVEVLGENPAWERTDEPTVTVPAEGDKTCVQILLVRADGRFSDPPQTACTEVEQ